MSDHKLTDLAHFPSLATGDFLYGVDVSDTTMSPEGTSKGFYVRDLSSLFYLIGDANVVVASTLNVTSGVLQSQITSLVNATGGYYPRSNPSGYVISASLTGYVNVMGDQTIYGSKTFDQAINVPFLNTYYIYVPSVGQAVDLSNRNFIWNDWKLAGKQISTSNAFTAQGTLTKIIPANPLPAVMSVSVGGGGDFIGYNESTLLTWTFSVDGNSYNVVFSATSENSPDIVVWNEGGGTPKTYGEVADAIVSFINSHYSGSVTAYNTGTGFGVNVITLTSLSLGSSSTVSVAAPIAGLTPDASPVYGVDNPETGTRFVTLQAGVGNVTHTIQNIFVKSLDAAWAYADIEIGYDNGTDFITVYRIPYSSLSGGSAISYIGSAGIAIVNFDHLDNTGELDGYSLAARTTHDGSPADETTGGEAIIHVIGTTY